MSGRLEKTRKGLLSAAALGTLATLAAVAGLAAVPAASSAAPLTFDLTHAATAGGADGAQTYALPGASGVSVTLSSVLASTLFDSPPTPGRPMSFNASASEAAGCAASGTSLACDGDGIGIRGGANRDEIDREASSDEALLIGVSSADPLRLASVEFLDLFLDEAVVGAVTVLGGGVTPFALAGSNATSGGYGLLNLSGLLPGAIGNDFVLSFRSTARGSDFSVARVSFELAAPAAVGEPATIALIVIALITLAGTTRQLRGAPST